MERLFNSNGVATKPSKKDLEEDVEYFSIGTEGDPRIIKLAKGVPRECKQRYLDLFKEYMDVFPWPYDDLNTFYLGVIQHEIPLKDGVKPYKQKLRKINSLFLPSIEKEVNKLLWAKIIVSLR